MREMTSAESDLLWELDASWTRILERYFPPDESEICVHPEDLVVLGADPTKLAGATLFGYPMRSAPGVPRGHVGFWDDLRRCYFVDPECA